MNEKQQIQFDRMVDGELSAAEERELLLGCERDESWKGLALAYVESQTWRSELPLLVDRPNEFVIERRNREAGGGTWNPLALAVAVLLSLGAGYGLGWSWQEDVPRTLNGVQVAEREAPQQLDQGRLASIPLMVADPSSGSLRQVELPVVKASALHPNWLEQFRSEIPDELLAELRGSGIDVSRTHVFAPVEFDDGKRIVVPIEYYIERDYQ